MYLSAVVCTVLCNNPHDVTELSPTPFICKPSLRARTGASELFLQLPNQTTCMLVLAITIALGVNMPISMERGKGKGRGKKRKATAAVDVNPVEPKNCKTAEQPASPVLTQSQRYVPRFTTKSKRSRVSSSEAVPVAPSQILGTAEDVHEPTQPEKERRTKSSLPEHEAELQAVEQVRLWIV